MLPLPNNANDLAGARFKRAYKPARASKPPLQSETSSTSGSEDQSSAWFSTERPAWQRLSNSKPQCFPVAHSSKWESCSFSADWFQISGCRTGRTTLKLDLLLPWILSGQTIGSVDSNCQINPPDDAAIVLQRIEVQIVFQVLMIKAVHLH